MLLVSALIGALANEQTAVSFAEPPAVLSHSPAPVPQANSRVATSGTFAWPPKAQPRAWKSIVVHHSATSGGSVSAIDSVHRRQRDSNGRPWLGIGYHFVVGNGNGMADGEVQATFRWRDQLAGAHAGERTYNDSGIGICLIGNFEQAAPTQRQTAAVAELVRSLKAEYAIDARQVVRHQDFQSTHCPGRLFPWQQMVAEASTASRPTNPAVR